jgi:hypothetical protein
VFPALILKPMPQTLNRGIFGAFPGDRSWVSRKVDVGSVGSSSRRSVEYQQLSRPSRTLNLS